MEFLKKLKLDFKKMILGSVILNILFLVFGVIIFMNATIALEVVGVLIGVYFILFGLFAILEFFMRKDLPIFSVKIFIGVLAFIIGILIMFDPFRITKIITFALGLYLIVVAIGKLVESIQFKKYGYDGWLILFVTSIILLAFGVFITINPMASLDLVQAAAIFIILSSILEICNLIMIYSRAKEIVKLFKKEN